MPTISSDIGSRAAELFRKSCNECHGDKKPSGGLRILDFSSYRNTSSILDLKEPEKSELYKKLQDGEMPPPGNKKGIPPLTTEEKSLVLSWIAAGAPEPKNVDVAAPVPARRFIADEEVTGLISKDLETQDGNRFQTRYFTLHHLYNAGKDLADIDVYRKGLSKLLNSLSTESQVLNPTAIDQDGLILRIYLADYAWNDATWQRLEKEYPYSFFANSDMRIATRTRIPVLRADWFAFNASRPPLYHDILGVPNTEAQLEQFLGVNALDNISRFRVVRAGFPGRDVPGGSGVSDHNRLIERHNGPFGYYWKSYDFAESNGERDLFSRPLGPVGLGFNERFKFKQDGGEFIFSLPNGLQGYFISDAKGKRIDAAPENVVRNEQAIGSKTVVNGISCMECHSSGIRRRDDQILTSQQNLQSGSDFGLLRAVQRLYPGNTIMQKIFEADEVRFKTALKALDVNPSDREPISTLAYAYRQPLSVADLAAELGLTKDNFLKQVELTANIAPAVLSAIPNGKVARDTFEREFQGLVRRLPAQGYEKSGVDKMAKKE